MDTLRAKLLPRSLPSIVVAAVLVVAIRARRPPEVEVPAINTLPVATIEVDPRIVHVEVQHLDFPVVRRADGAWLYDSDPRCIGKVRTNLEALRACLERNGGWD